VAEEELGQDEDEPRPTMEEQEQEDEPRPTMEEEEDDLVKQQEQEDEPRPTMEEQEQDDLVKQPTPEEELLGLELCAVSFWALPTFRGWSLPTVSRRRHKEVAHGSI
jgi:hypothetical protein